MSLPNHVLAFDKNNYPDWDMKPIVPRRFDITFNPTCKPDANTICYYAKLQEGLSVADEEATRHNIKIGITAIYRQVVEQLKNPFVLGREALLDSNYFPLQTLNIGERDDAKNRELNTITKYSPYPHDNRFVVQGQRVVNYHKIYRLNIPMAMIMFGIMESLAVTLTKKFKADSDLTGSQIYGLLRSATSHLIDKVEYQNFSIKLNDFQLDRSLIAISLGIENTLTKHAVIFKFNVHIYSDCTSVLIEDSDYAELYLNCFAKKD